jgi:hypothetical protein
MNETAMQKRMLQDNIYDKKDKKTQAEMVEDVYVDLHKLKVKGWRGKMKNREEWRRNVQEAKPHPELQCQGEGRK